MNARGCVPFSTYASRWRAGTSLRRHESRSDDAMTISASYRLPLAALTIGVILFVLATANGYRIWWSSGPIVLACAVIIVGVRLLRAGPVRLLRVSWQDMFLLF